MALSLFQLPLSLAWGDRLDPTAQDSVRLTPSFLGSCDHTLGHAPQ